MAKRRGSGLESRSLAAAAQRSRARERSECVDVTVKSDDETETECPFVKLRRDLSETFRKMDPEGRALQIRRDDEERRRDPTRPPFMWLPSAYGAPVRFEIEPKKLRGHFRDETTPQLTVACGRPSGYGHDFTRDVSVRYLAGAKGVNVAGAVKFAIEVARRYQAADAIGSKQQREQEERREEERAMGQKLGVYEAGIGISRMVYGYWSATPSMASRGFDFTDAGLREFVKLAKRERVKCAKLREAHAKREGSDG